MTKEEILDETMRCTIDDDADIDNPENFYFRYNDVLTAMETYAQQQAKNCSILKRVKKFFADWKYIHKNDPVKKCELYKNEGCSHVDGMLCDFPNCSMNNDYIKERSLS